MINQLPANLVPAIVPLLAALVMLGCGSPERAADGPNGVDPDAIEPVRLVEHIQGNDDALAEPRLELIRSGEAFEALGTDLGLSPADLDFEQHSVIVFALGEQPTGGYWAKIVGAQRVGDTLWVQAVANAPGEDDITTQALTYPYAAAIVPRVDDNVQVREDVRSVTGEDPDAFSSASR